jgi:pSer/pThr/pTyr-binding forkhead associated (FHA) protein
MKEPFENDRPIVDVGDFTRVLSDKDTAGWPDRADYPQLFCRKGEGLKGKSLPLLQSLTLGRESSCDIHLDDTSISRKHAELVVKGASVRIRDLESSNHVYLNDRRVDESALMDRDIIRLADTFEFVFISALDEDLMATVPISPSSSEGEGDATVAVSKVQAKSIRVSAPNKLRKRLILLILLIGVPVVGAIVGSVVMGKFQPGSQSAEISADPRTGDDLTTGSGDASPAGVPAATEESATGEAASGVVAEASPTATATPLPKPTPTPTPPPLTATLVEQGLLEPWKEALVKGAYEDLGNLYGDKKAPVEWRGLSSAAVANVETQIEPAAGVKDGYTLWAELGGAGAGSLLVQMEWIVGERGGELFVAKETLEPESMKNLLLLPSRVQIGKDGLDNVWAPLSELFSLLESDVSLKAKVGWNKDAIRRWKQEVTTAAGLLKRAQEAKSQGQNPQTLKAYRDLEDVLAASDFPLFVEGAWKSWIAGRIESVREKPQRPLPSPTPALDPKIVERAAALIGKAQIGQELGKLDEAKQLFREAAGLLPADHPMRQKIPPWALID